MNRLSLLTIGKELYNNTQIDYNIRHLTCYNLTDYNFRFFWAKLRNSPVLWPVQRLEEQEQKQEMVHVYVKSDNAM